MRKTEKRVRSNFRLPPKLLKWAQSYAKKKHVSLTQAVIDGLVLLKEKDRV